MSAALGIGVRVYIGWCASEQINGPDDPRLHTGTIIDGLRPPGMYEDGSGGAFIAPYQSWKVAVDGGSQSWIAQMLLTPIDDDRDAAEQFDRRAAHA